MNANWWRLTRIVAGREITERARARSFWIASVLLLIAVAAGVLIPALLHGTRSSAQVGVIGTRTPALTETVREAGQISGTTVTIVSVPDEAAARAGLRSGRLAAVLVGDSEVLVKQESVTGTSSPGSTLAGALAQVGGLQKLYAELPPGAAARIARDGIALPVHGLTPPPRGLVSRVTGLAAAILIYVIILTYGVRITIGVGEEKSSRVVEVLLTTLRPTQLLAGKVIGMGTLALAQIGVLVGTYFALGYAVGSSAVRGAAGGVVLAGGLWLVLGYVFYCTAYAAAGSLITRQADAYNASLPLQLPLIFGYLLAYTVVYANGVSWFYHLLGFIPFTAPVVMPVLVAVGAAPAWQMLLSIAITLAATVGMARLAGRIYERAILRTGTRLRARQVLRSAD
jgi:ABC-2 type transport system permease protein